jgi:rhomboid protease GluP
MYALLSFGTSLERYFGHGRFFLLYVLSAFTGNVASFLFSPGYSIGASTAIFGLLGAEAVFLIQNRKAFPGQFRSAIGNIIFIAAINLFIIGSLPGIDNWGHIGGLIGGLMFTSFAGPLWELEGVYPAYRLVDRRSFRAVMIGAAVVILIFGALAMWGMAGGILEIGD